MAADTKKKKKRATYAERFPRGGDLIFWSVSGDFGPLSPYYEEPFEIDGEMWGSVIQYVEATRVADPEVRDQILMAETSVQASALALRADIRHDWDEIKDETLRKAYMSFYQAHTGYKRILCKTKGYRLIYASSDPYWGRGVDKQGRNRLGEILTEVRKHFLGRPF